MNFTKGAPYIPSIQTRTPDDTVEQVSKVEQERAAGQVQRWNKGDPVLADGHPAVVIAPLFSTLYGWYYEIESPEGVRAKLVASRLKKMPPEKKAKR